MKFLPLLPLLLLASCKDTPPPELPSRPKELPPEQRLALDATLASQTLGQELHGRTHWLGPHGFKEGPLDKAPKLYFIYFSASW
ncbi:MAG: hypothetical protein ACSHYF_14290 [Verrucomicrobiaceae bacterium]